MDTGVLIRRALLFRSIIERSANHLIQHNVSAGAGGKPVTKGDLDPGVVSAFLRVQRYKYGARSMEAIVSMSKLAGRSMFERSCLPTEAQLGIHVDPDAFLELVRRETSAKKSMPAHAS